MAWPAEARDYKPCVAWREWKAPEPRVWSSGSTRGSSAPLGRGDDYRADPGLRCASPRAFAVHAFGVAGWGCGFGSVAPPWIPIVTPGGLEIALAKAGAMPMVWPLNWFSRSVALMMLVLWVPVGMHCTLETLPGFSFLQWCCGGEAPHADHDCSSDSCSVVESGLYKIEEHSDAAFHLAPPLVCVEWDLTVQGLVESPRQLAPVASAPPELPRSWQFSCRTALAPRAPSLDA